MSFVSKLFPETKLKDSSWTQTVKLFSVRKKCIIKTRRRSINGLRLIIAQLFSDYSQSYRLVQDKFVIIHIVENFVNHYKAYPVRDTSKLFVNVGRVTTTMAAVIIIAIILFVFFVMAFLLSSRILYIPKLQKGPNRDLTSF